MTPRRSRSRSRGGKNGSEPGARLRLRALQVMEYVLEGRSQTQIAETLGISQPAVSKIVRRLEEQLLADVAWKVERQRARHSLRLEFLYAEAVRAWRASQQETLRRRQRKTDGGPGPGSTVAELVSENRHGDPRYLEAARNMLVDLRALWGVNAPDRLSVEAGSPFASMTDAALEAELARQARLLHPADPTASAVLATPDPEDHHDPS
jgi:DNA-binding CsgD family transcriptional regulator